MKTVAAASTLALLSSVRASHSDDLQCKKFSAIYGMPYAI
jgi:hypothetical protein